MDSKMSHIFACWFRAASLAFSTPGGDPVRWRRAKRPEKAYRRRRRLEP